MDSFYPDPTWDPFCGPYQLMFLVFLSFFFHFVALFDFFFHTFFPLVLGVNIIMPLGCMLGLCTHILSCSMLEFAHSWFREAQEQ